MNFLVMGSLFLLARTNRDAIGRIFSLGMFFVFSGGMTSTAPRSKCCCHCLVSASKKVSCSSVSKTFGLSSLPLRDLKLGFKTRRLTLSTLVMMTGSSAVKLQNE